MSFERLLEKGFFKGRNISVSTNIPGASKPIIVESTMAGKGDPYALTAGKHLCSAFTLEP